MLMSAVSSVSLLSLIPFFYFSGAKSPRSLCRLSPNFDTCSVATQVYKIVSDIWGPSPEKVDGPNASKFGPSFGQFRTLIAERNKVIVELKTTLQTAISPAHLVHKRLKWDRSFDRSNALALRGSRFVVCSSMTRSLE